GPVMAQSIFNFFRDKEIIFVLEKLRGAGVKTVERPTFVGAPKQRNHSEALDEESIFSEKNIFSEKRIVLTGTLKDFTRNQVTGLIKHLGGRVTSSVSPKTSFVLAGEEPGSKLEKAKTLGIKIINEKEFKSLIHAG
ncbi:MAG: hypothetical protein COS11_06685, partial [bacterium (Candidatus Ratteibacteria) CG01_land_8_20_14_3_00_40_19]